MPTIKPTTKPIAHDETIIRVQGEALHPTIWRGRQWAVTTYGIERRDGCYAIEARRLAESHPDWSWVAQLGRKRDVDLDDFTTAFLIACCVHQAKLDRVDVDLVLEHYSRLEKRVKMA